MRFSRPCYDKYHRCPGWAGGGFKYANISRCDDGTIQTYLKDYSRPKLLWKWRFHRCNKCNVIVFPYHSRWLDPTWIFWKFFALKRIKKVIRNAKTNRTRT
jgi:hypothetical protein